MKVVAILEKDKEFSFVEPKDNVYYMRIRNLKYQHEKMRKTLAAVIYRLKEKKILCLKAVNEATFFATQIAGTLMVHKASKDLVDKYSVCVDYDMDKTKVRIYIWPKK